MRTDSGTPAISVLIPSYNHERFVEIAIRSVFAQSLKPEKLIVIDDGSNDESVRLIESTLKDCPFECELIARENRGLCRTLNEGIAKTGGDYFAYLGSDDVWLRDFLKEGVGQLESKKEAALSFGDAFVIDETGRIIDSTAEWSDHPESDPLTSLLKGRIFSSPTVIYRRAVLENYGWNEEAQLEDYELYLKLALDWPFARTESISCGWRVHGSNTSRNLPVILKEIIAARDRLRRQIRVSDRELVRFEKEMRLSFANNLARFGFKREAFSMMNDGPGGFTSLTDTLKLLIRLIVPHRVTSWNRKRKHDRYARIRGSIHDL